MTKYLLPIFDVYRVRGVSLIKFTYFDSCLVDILSLIKKKKHFFVLAFHFEFPANLLVNDKNCTVTDATRFSFVFICQNVQFF